MLLPIFLFLAMSSTTRSMSTINKKIVIVGGGIHGVTLAYFLAEAGAQPTIIERSGVAAAASGKAGGFLARNWGSGPTTALHEKSYDMHKEFAEKLNLESYRQVDTLNVNGNIKGTQT